MKHQCFSSEIPREIREQLVKLTATVFSETQKTQLDQFVNMIVESAQRPDLVGCFLFQESSIFS